MRRITLKKYGCYEPTRGGAYIYMKNGTRAFIPRRIIKKLIRG